MHPFLIVLHLFGVERPIGSYGMCLALAIVAAATIATRGAIKGGIDPWIALSLVGFVTMGSFLGGYSLFVIVEWITTGSPLEAMSRGGLVFLGAPIGGGLALVLSARKLELPLGRFADHAIAAVPAAHALGRLGCFLAGCCFGAEHHGPLAVIYSHPFAPAAYPAIPRHPWPLYESFALLVVAFCFVLVPPKSVGKGRRAFAYCAIYGVLRVLLEPLRGDAVRGVFAYGVSTSQLLGTLLALVGVAGLVVTRERPAERLAAS